MEPTLRVRSASATPSTFLRDRTYNNDRWNYPRFSNKLLDLARITGDKWLDESGFGPTERGLIPIGVNAHTDGFGGAGIS
jgi:hypothetical protein